MRKPTHTTQETVDDALLADLILYKGIEDERHQHTGNNHDIQLEIDRKSEPVGKIPEKYNQKVHHDD